MTEDNVYWGVSYYGDLSQTVVGLIAGEVINSPPPPIHLILPVYGPGAESASNRYEYQKIFLECKAWPACKDDNPTTIYEPIV
jgi:hypothetical protein